MKAPSSDSKKSVKTYLEGKVFFATTIVSLCPVSIKVNRKGSASQIFEEQIFPHQFFPQIVEFRITVSIGLIHSIFEVSDGILAVLDFGIDTGVQGRFGTVPVRVFFVEPEI